MFIHTTEQYLAFKSNKPDLCISIWIGPKM